MENNQLTKEKIRELYDKGYAYLNSGSEEEALSVFRELGEMGISAAQFNLGAMYYNGQGTARDYQEALKWYRMAADKGLKEAQFALGDMYEYGTGVDCVLEQAAEWYIKAADQGHVRAYKSLGKVNAKIEQKEQGYPYYVDTPSDIKLGSIYHDCGQPIFITQKGGVGMLSSIGGCLLTGELLRDVTFEGIDAEKKTNRNAIRKVLVADQNGTFCKADILGFARQEGDENIYKQAVSYYAGDYVRLIVRSEESLNGWREPLELFCDNSDSDTVKTQTKEPKTSKSTEKQGNVRNDSPERGTKSVEKEDIRYQDVKTKNPILKWTFLLLAVIGLILLCVFLFS